MSNLLDFKGANVPILGQPFAQRVFMPIIMGVCQCEAKEPLMLVAAAPVTCIHCKRTWLINKLVWNRETGEFQCEVAQMLGMPEGKPV